MVEIYDIDNLVLMQPKRMMKYILVWCASGTVDLVVDENNYQLKANDTLTITSGQYHFYKNTADVKGYMLVFTYDFFCKDDSDIELVFHNGLFCHFDQNEIIKADLSILLQRLKQEVDNQSYQYQILTHSIIKIMLVELNRAKIQRGDEVWKPTALFLTFLDKVRSSFSINPSLIELAEQLGTSVAKLNTLSRQHAGKTAQNVIHGLIASEAKRQLIYEKLTIKEIAYGLGFSDPFYFSAFFKKQTADSPKGYREKHMLL